jgi:hypothetical protein
MCRSMLFGTVEILLQLIWKPLLIAMEESEDCSLQLHYLENIHGTLIEMSFINFMEELIDRFEKERFKAAS